MTHRNHARRHGCQAAGLIAATLFATQAAVAETPQDRYDIDRTCEALSTSGIAMPNKTPDDSKSLADVFAKRLQESGAALGRSPDQIASDLQHERADTHARLYDADPNRARAAQAEAATMEEKCAALLGFEILDRAGKP